jgi:hypothetical protein
MSESASLQDFAKTLGPMIYRESRVKRESVWWTGEEKEGSVFLPSSVTDSAVPQGRVAVSFPRRESCRVLILAGDFGFTLAWALDVAGNCMHCDTNGTDAYHASPHPISSRRRE